MLVLRNYLHKSIVVINATIMLAMFLILLLQVFTRKLLESSLSWPEEVALVTMIWITFAGAYQVTIEDKHLKMDFLEDKVPYSVKPYMRILSRVIVVIFLGIATFWGMSFVESAGSVKMPVSKIPMAVPYLIILISLSLMLVEYLIQIFIEVKKLLAKKEET